ncbi:glutathione S-transferase [Chloropicon primus]|uniref:glutathione transferase n=1 Tax=Chloropicon primus TaxID=1764295 RepID=A0A5B8MW02_9CHLO|nr:glutathione S-transferase [Chloropicon primus]UPR02863.1 glutathione S-transferase [Chloropicon primus]|mmetsp:Transcript_10740/g.30245  ORF Transcript_10740/g.30245 Transcript_10740/m.30245 type:complete len:239 (-) Transcript_10740:1189-1905(-)|eukprot:QDZ23650.1 glutathione S-transferase [Chloropicon primus]
MEGGSEAKRPRTGKDGNKVQLGYWAIKGLGQPIRLLLEYAAFDYEDVLYFCVQKEDGSFDKSSWFDNKFSLGLPFPNLPYLVDGDLKITQTNAILQYLANRAGLAGETTEDRARVNMLLCYSQDVRKRYTAAAYSKDFHDMKGDLVEFIRSSMVELEGYLKSFGEDGSCFLVGKKATFVDLLWYDLIDQFLVLDASLLDGRQGLRTLYDAIHNHERIAEYRNSDRYIKQMNNTTATFK